MTTQEDPDLTVRNNLIHYQVKERSWGSGESYSFVVVNRMEFNRQERKERSYVAEFFVNAMSTSPVALHLATKVAFALDQAEQRRLEHLNSLVI